MIVVVMWSSASFVQSPVADVASATAAAAAAADVGDDECDNRWSIHHYSFRRLFNEEEEEKRKATINFQFCQYQLVWNNEIFFYPPKCQYKLANFDSVWWLLWLMT